MTLGRQFLWNNLQTARFDGIALGRHTGTFRNSRQLTLYAGLSGILTGKPPDR